MSEMSWVELKCEVSNSMNVDPQRRLNIKMVKIFNPPGRLHLRDPLYCLIWDRWKLDPEWYAGVTSSAFQRDMGLWLLHYGTLERFALIILQNMNGSQRSFWKWSFDWWFIGDVCTVFKCKLATQNGHCLIKKGVNSQSELVKSEGPGICLAEIGSCDESLSVQTAHLMYREVSGDRREVYRDVLCWVCLCHHLIGVHFVPFKRFT